MKSYEGGAIPFSAMLGGRNTKKRSKKRVSRTRRRVKKTKTKTKKKSKKVNNLYKCSCEIINDMSPDGLGFCANCSPLNIIMRGKDKKLWRLEQMWGHKKWYRVK